RLIIDLFADTVCHSVVVNLLLVATFVVILAGNNFFLFLFVELLLIFAIPFSLATLLFTDRVGELLKEVIRLPEQMRDTRVLGLSQEFQVSLFIVSLQSLQTLLGSPLHTLLLFALHVLVVLQHHASQFVHAIALLLSSILKFDAMVED